MRSHRIEERRGEVLALCEAKQDITLDELRVALAGIGLSSTLHRFFALHGITRKKDRGTIEKDRSDVLSQRQAWFDGQCDLDPERLVFIDET